MTASLTSKGNKYYVIVSFKQGGKRKQKWVNTNLTVSGHNKRKAEQARIAILREYQSKIISDESEVTFANYIRRWIENEQKYDVCESTYFDQQKMVNNTIAPYFNNILICDLTDTDIEDFYKFRQRQYNVSANTVKHYHAVIRKCLQYAVKHKVIASNPADFVDLPKVETPEANVYDDECLKKFLNYVKNDFTIDIVVYLAAWFGFRRGEIAGLRWCDVDFENKTISVNGVVKDKGTSGSKIKNLKWYPTAKTKKSLRTLPMDDKCVKYLQEVKKRQERWQLFNRDKYNHQWDGFICTRPNGDLIPLEYMSRRVPALTVKAGLPRLKLHELRHTNLSMLLDGGATSKQTAVWAGHSNERMLAERYDHLRDKNSLKELASIVNKVISA